MWSCKQYSLRCVSIYVSMGTHRCRSKCSFCTYTHVQHTQTEEEKARGLPVVFPDFDRLTCKIPANQVNSLVPQASCLHLIGRVVIYLYITLLFTYDYIHCLHMTTYITIRSNLTLYSIRHYTAKNFLIRYSSLPKSSVTDVYFRN